MSRFYSEKKGGFYDAGVHGTRLVGVIDPLWVRPLNADGTPDADAVAKTIEVINPDCKVPTDAVEITAEEHEDLLQAQSEGKYIRANAQGYPIALEPALPPFTELKEVELSNFRRDREAMLNRIAGIGFAALLAGGTSKAIAIAGLREGLLKLPSSAPVVAATTLPALKHAMLQQYKTLAIADGLNDLMPLVCIPMPRGQA